MKKLIPTIGMALLSAAMLGTSTFAWFSANSTASASGLQISAKASASLLISNTSGSGYAASTTLSASNGPSTTVAPTTHTSYSFKKLTAEDMLHVNPDGSIMTGYTPTYVATTTDYYKSAVYLMYSGGDSDKVVASATLSNSDPKDSIWQAVHVDLVSEGTAVCQFTFTELGAAVTSSSKIDVANGVEKALDVYMWVEGTDSHCYNGAALNGDSYALSFSFAVDSSAE